MSTVRITVEGVELERHISLLDDLLSGKFLVSVSGGWEDDGVFVLEVASNEYERLVEELVNVRVKSDSMSRERGKAYRDMLDVLPAASDVSGGDEVTVSLEGVA